MIDWINQILTNWINLVNYGMIANVILPDVMLIIIVDALVAPRVIIVMLWIHIGNFYVLKSLPLYLNLKMFVWVMHVHFILCWKLLLLLWHVPMIRYVNIITSSWRKRGHMFSRRIWLLVWHLNLCLHPLTLALLFLNLKIIKLLFLAFFLLNC